MLNNLPPPPHAHPLYHQSQLAVAQRQQCLLVRKDEVKETAELKTRQRRHKIAFYTERLIGRT
jgi:hypothetical protein